VGRHKIGRSTPPLGIDQGSLILCHGVRTAAPGSVYRLGLALLDRESPVCVIRRTDERAFGLKARYGPEGDGDDAGFLYGWIVKGGIVHMYYAADFSIAAAPLKLSDLIDFNTQCPAADSGQVCSDAGRYFPPHVKFRAELSLCASCFAPLQLKIPLSRWTIPHTIGYDPTEGMASALYASA
jgi:hypothetical protein